jgi:hypothetical protein
MAVRTGDRRLNTARLTPLQPSLSAQAFSKGKVPLTEHLVLLSLCPTLHNANAFPLDLSIELIGYVSLRGLNNHRPQSATHKLPSPHPALPYTSNPVLIPSSEPTAGKKRPDRLLRLVRFSTPAFCPNNSILNARGQCIPTLSVATSAPDPKPRICTSETCTVLPQLHQHTPGIRRPIS